MRLAAWLQPVQKHAAARGYRHTFVGGSSAREILDTLWHGAPLELRDLDLYWIQGQAAEPGELLSLTSALQPGVGPDRVRIKRRANPALPDPGRLQYITGYGVHVYCEGMPTLSLSLLHSQQDLALGGLFDIDTVLLRLDNEGSLQDFELLDPYGGYPAWRSRQLRVVHWDEIERCWVRHSVRMVRSLAKVGRFVLDAELVREHQARRPIHSDTTELPRDLVKLLGDSTWQQQLRMLHELGALPSICPELARLVELQDPVVSPGRASAARARAHAALQVLHEPASRALMHEVLASVPLVYGSAP